MSEAPKGAIAWLATAIVVKFVIPALPVFSGHSINQAAGICNSSLGAIAQAFSRTLSNDCGLVNGISLVINVIAGIALLLAVIFGIQWTRKRATA